ncbi:MAG: transcription antitermination factor NusB [Desulfobacteraceae bacterium]|jgi:N utilization substance protein B|nr:transcription antitermination factor NusB [Desulfobacteraceae bacterium]
MGTRRKSRELAMQALFCMDTLKNESDELLEGLSGMLELAPDINRFYMTLIKGVIDNKSQIDKRIEQFSSNWKINRMGCVDRNILRIAAYEILYCHDIPPKVSINEAVDIGKLYGTEESGSFINGILDGIYQQQAAKNKKNENSD